MDFFQLFHQVAFVVQPPGSVGDQHINTSRSGSRYRIVNHRGAVRTGVLGDHRHTVAFTPDFKLFDSGGTEGVTGGQHDAFAFALKTLGKFANGGGFTHAVNAYH